MLLPTDIFLMSVFLWTLPKNRFWKNTKMEKKINLLKKGKFFAKGTIFIPIN